MEAFFETLWKSLVLVLVGILLLRIGGRKSISQMTLATTVVMISVGSIIIQPIVETSIWRTILATSVFVISLVFLEWLQMKYNFLENFITGKAKTVIENGQPLVKNLKKVRLTVDQLEMRLRQQGIEKIADVKTATLEANGQLGYELMRHAKPLTIGEFEKMVGILIPQKPETQSPGSTNIFDEVKQDGHTIQNPKQLQ